MPALIKTPYAPNADHLTVGMMSAELEEAHRAKLAEVMDHFHALPEYWVLVAPVDDPNHYGLKLKFMVFSQLPVIQKYVKGKSALIPFMGTVCYYRNNKTMRDRDIVRVWCLMPDFPIPSHFFEDGEDASPHLADDAWRLGVPMIY